jgi:hypothetical protein
MLRQAVHPVDYPDFNLKKVHLRHCIGAIRQALMCFGDVSTIAWQWNEQKQKAEQRDDIVHTCRDYNRLRDWAIEHQFDYYNETNLKIYLDDDLSIPEF